MKIEKIPIQFCITLLLPLFVMGCQSSIDSTSDHIRENAWKVITTQETEPSEPTEESPTLDIYKKPPRINNYINNDGNDVWGVLYRGRNHTPEELEKYVKAFFADMEIDPKTKQQISIPNYSTLIDEGTNQLTVKCPDEALAKTVLQFLEDHDDPPVQVKITCLISEIYADMTFDRETTLQLENLFGEHFTTMGTGRSLGSDVPNIIDQGNIVPNFLGGSPRDPLRALMGLKAGYVKSGSAVALLDWLESKGFLKIMMKPVLEVVNGRTARLESTEDIRRDQNVTMSAQGFVQTEREFVKVKDSLEVTPHVFDDGYIGLETRITIMAANTPLGITQLPIITEKTIHNEQNRIREGHALIIGGIRKTMDFGVHRGLPILKDIPIIGFLFSGEDTEKRVVETVFMLIPEISSGGTSTEKMLKMIEDKHNPSKTETEENEK